MRAINKLKSFVTGATNNDEKNKTTSDDTKAQLNNAPKPSLRVEKSTPVEQMDDLAALILGEEDSAPLVRPGQALASTAEKTPLKTASPKTTPPEIMITAPELTPSEIKSPEITSKPIVAPAAKLEDTQVQIAVAPIIAKLEAPAASPETPIAASPIAARQLVAPRKTESLTHIRKDLAQLNEDMSTGEQFYAQSLKRISNLIDYAYETEANLSALEQLEPENLRLKTALSEAREKLTDETVRAESLKSKADAYEARYLDARQGLEKAQLTLTQLENTRDSLRRDINDKDGEIAKIQNAHRVLKGAQAVDRKSQEQLASKNLELSSDLSVALNEKLELEKRAHEVTTRHDTLLADKQNLERMVEQTRNSQRTTEDHNLALKTELEQVLADVQIFKQQFDASTRNRDAEITQLNATVTTLESEVTVKSGVVTHAHEEMAELRQQHDAAHRGRRKLIDHIEAQKSDFDALQESLKTARNEINAFSTKLADAQIENDQLRRVNTLQSDKLKRYCSLNSSQIDKEGAYPLRSKPKIYTQPRPSSDERRAAGRPFETTRMREDIVEQAIAPNSPADLPPVVDAPKAREYTALHTLSPLGLALPESAILEASPIPEAAASPAPEIEAPIAAPQEPSGTEAEQIENALLGMHDIDLLASNYG
ncbi:MAG: hypothetical protein V3U82_04480 [Robiginitomaculum sp.]